MFMPELDCALAFVMDHIWPRSFVFPIKNKQTNKQNHNAFVICHPLKLNKGQRRRRRSSPLFSSAGGTRAPIRRPRPPIGSGPGEEKKKQNATARPYPTAAAATHQLTGRTCSETDGVRKRVGTVWDELHICRSQGIGPQPVRDYTAERRSQPESAGVWVQL